jgi:hypothetical protein
MKNPVFVFLMVAMVGIAAVIIAMHLPASRSPAPADSEAIAEVTHTLVPAPVSPGSPAPPQVPQPSLPASVPTPTPSPVTPPIQPPPQGQRITRPAGPPVMPEGPVPEPVARRALGFVGTDADAERVWGAAINDPGMPANDRKNLIEDLNEDGFPDPRNITMDDLPLIEARIALIEQIGNDAMDETNYAAFQEAYKDLINMRSKLTGQ